MMLIKRLPLLVAGGVGYVLGTKAGRERYEQLRRTFNQVRNDPRVQQKTQQAADFAKEQAPVVKDKVTGAAGAAASKVSGNGGGGTHLVDQLHPDSTARQDNPGPQGDLP